LTKETLMPDTTNEEQMRTLVENWAAAVRAINIEGAVAHDTDDIVMFDVPLPVHSRGISEYSETWELFFANNVTVGPLWIARIWAKFHAAGERQCATSDS
jgi:ketosteroid isomerase-like protein